MKYSLHEPVHLNFANVDGTIVSRAESIFREPFYLVSYGENGVQVTRNYSESELSEAINS